MTSAKLAPLLRAAALLMMRVSLLALPLLLLDASFGQIESRWLPLTLITLSGVLAARWRRVGSATARVASAALAAAAIAFTPLLGCGWNPATLVTCDEARSIPAIGLAVIWFVLALSGGLRLERDDNDGHIVSFQRTLLILLFSVPLAALLLDVDLNAPALAPLLTSHLLAYILGGVIALALEHTGGQGQLEPRIALTHSLAVAAVIGLGGILAVGLVFPAGRQALAVIFGGLFALAAVVAAIPFAIIGWLASQIGFREQTGAMPTVGPLMNEMIDRGELDPVQEAASQSSLLQISQYILLAVLVALAIGWLLRRSWERREERTDQPVDAIQRRSVFRARDLLDDLRPRWGRRKPEALDASPSGQVRRRYRRFLERALAQGHERQPAATPRAFATQLTDQADPAALTTLTTLYEQARYGTAPPEAVPQAQAALETLERSIKPKAS